jgi:hypothetical protein
MGMSRYENHLCVEKMGSKLREWRLQVNTTRYTDITTNAAEVPNEALQTKEKCIIDPPNQHRSAPISEQKRSLDRGPKNHIIIREPNIWTNIVQQTSSSPGFDRMTRKTTPSPSLAGDN